MKMILLGITLIFLEAGKPLLKRLLVVSGVPLTSTVAIT